MTLKNGPTTCLVRKQGMLWQLLNWRTPTKNSTFSSNTRELKAPWSSLRACATCSMSSNWHQQWRKLSPTFLPRWHHMHSPSRAPWEKSWTTRSRRSKTRTTSMCPCTIYSNERASSRSLAASRSAIVRNLVMITFLAHMQFRGSRKWRAVWAN